MKKAANLLLSAMVLAVFISAFSSCSEDEKKTAEVSFALTAQTVDEDELEIFIPYEIKNGPTEDDATISFSFSGTATEDEDFAFTGWNDDGVYLELLDDIDVENNETIIVTMTDSDNVDISTPSIHTVTIDDDDVDTGTNLKIDLEWDAGDGTPGDVDMDLILWEYDEINDEFDFIDESIAATGFESLPVFAADPDATYGLTFLYYDGTSNDVEFTVKFVTTDGTIDGSLHQRTFTATYTLDNLNSTPNVFIEQFFDKNGTDYNSFTAIDVPEEGSRVKSFKLPSGKREKNSVTKSITVRKISK